MTTGAWTSLACAPRSETSVRRTFGGVEGQVLGRVTALVYHGSGLFRDFVHAFTKTYPWG